MDPSLGRFTTVDPLAEKYPAHSPYAYTMNNPVMLIDPTGMEATKYEDEEGNLLLNTSDGSDAVVTVTDDKRVGFDAAVRGTENTDDVAWNNSMKKYALGFELSEGQESLLSSMNSDWSRKNAIDYWQDPSISNAAAFVFSEALSQWTNPELVVGGLSAGIGGFTVKLNVYRVYGDGAKPSGFSWTTVNPNTVGNYRNAAGLPNVNSGRFVIQGRAGLNDVIKSRSALPLDGNAGGLPELIINPANVKINNVSGANPNF